MLHMYFMNILESSQLKTVRPFPTLTLFIKGGNDSLVYYGPRDFVNLVTFVNDGIEYFERPPPPKVSN